MTISTMCGTSFCAQSQNVGRARSQGLELDVEGQLGGWTLDGHYQYLDRDNLSNPSVLLTDTPRQQMRLHAGWQASDALSLHGTTKAASRRYSNSTGTQVASGFTVLDLKAVWRVTPATAVEAGVHNVGDRLYAYTEGFPEPGRQGFVQLRFTLQ
jgi:iron complex outermembrane receptor protein